MLWIFFKNSANRSITQWKFCLKTFPLKQEKFYPRTSSLVLVFFDPAVSCSPGRLPLNWTSISLSGGNLINITSHPRLATRKETETFKRDDFPSISTLGFSSALVFKQDEHQKKAWDFSSLEGTPRCPRSYTAQEYIWRKSCWCVSNVGLDCILSTASFPFFSLLTEKKGKNAFSYYFKPSNSFWVNEV